jgi:hypothetical protein
MTLALALRRVAMASALALAATSADAAIIAANLGTEAIISFANANGDTISFDSGDTSLAEGDSFALPTAVISFINAAGGAANITFGIISGNTTTRSYVTSSASASFANGPDDGGVQLANAVRNLWSGQLTQFVQDLNNSRPASPTSQNDNYGPFLTGTGSPNYLDGLFDNWGSGDFAFTSLGPGSEALYLYGVQFGTGSLGFASLTPLGGGVPLLASLNLAEGRIDVTAVPAPAAVWLLGTALLPVARRALRKRAATA